MNSILISRESEPSKTEPSYSGTKHRNIVEGKRMTYDTWSLLEADDEVVYHWSEHVHRGNAAQQSFNLKIACDVGKQAVVMDVVFHNEDVTVPV